MAEYWRITRLYLVLLALVTAARWFVSFRAPYELATDKVSIVITTMFASLLFAAFCRRWRRYGVVQAMVLGALFGVLAQLVIFVSTAASYAFGLDTYFNFHKALQADPGPVPLQLALTRRAGGLIAGPISNAMVALVGWALGALLPEDGK
jgi:hypothetical protein